MIATLTFLVFDTQMQFGNFTQSFPSFTSNYRLLVHKNCMFGKFLASQKQSYVSSLVQKCFNFWLLWVNCKTGSVMTEQRKFRICY